MFRYCLLFLILSTISSFGMGTTRGVKECYTSRDCPTGKPCFKGHCLGLQPRPFEHRVTPRRHTIDQGKTTVRKTVGHGKTTARLTIGQRRTTVHPTSRRV